MATATFQDGFNGYTGTADTKIKQASPTSAYGTATEIGVDSGTGIEEQVLLSFDNIFGTGPGQIPYGAVITSATLTLQTTNGSSQGGSLHRMRMGWTESTTWNTLGNGIQIDGTEAVAAADVTTGATMIGSRGFDVTNSLQAWAAGEANYGWVFKAGGTDGWDFSSSEGSAKPALSVTYTLPSSAPPPAPPVVSISGGAPNPQTEGAGARISFTLTLDSAATQPVTVSYSTLNGTALAGSDFTGITSGSVTFAAGETSKVVTVDLVDDAVQEGAESFSVKLDSASNATVSSTSHTATGNIADNDAPPPAPPPSAGPVLSILPDTKDQRAEGPATKFTFTLTLSQAASQDVKVTYSTVNGTAVAGSDFTGATKTVTFLAGQTSKTISISALDDTVQENPEWFAVKINSATGASISTSNHTATAHIVDNDLPATVVKVINTTQYKAGDPSGYGSGDPSGLAYVPGASGQPGSLFLVDSEHDESPYYSSANALRISLSDNSYTWSSLTAFTKEPTGVAYNAKDGLLYATDSSKNKVFWFDPANPSVKLGEFSLTGLGLTDTEDPTFDPNTGNMFILDGEGCKLHEMTSRGALVSTINLPRVLFDAEGFTYSHTTSDGRAVFFVGHETNSTIYQVDETGKILAATNVLSTYTNPVTGIAPKPKGLVVAPSSDPNDGGKTSLYVADYGVDQKNDGRLFEVNLGSGWFMA